MWYHYELVRGLVVPPQARIEKIQSFIPQILSQHQISVRNFMSLIGLLASTEKMVPLGRLHLRLLQWHLKNHWKTPASLETLIPLTAQLAPHLRWWNNLCILQRGAPLHPPAPDIQVYTDASLEWWGSHCQGSTVRGQWTTLVQQFHKK